MSRPCKNCQQVPYYSETYDTYYCKGCDIWLETQCSDPKCGFCKGREEKPSLALDIKKEFLYHIGFMAKNEGKQKFEDVIKEISDILSCDESINVITFTIKESGRKYNDMTDYDLEWSIDTTLEMMEGIKSYMGEITEILNEGDNIKIISLFLKEKESSL